MDYSYLEDQIRAAVTVREKGDLSLSRKMFEEVIKEIKETMESDPSKELKYIFATATGEYIIQYRMEGPDQFEKALKLGAELLLYDKQHHLDNPLSIRAVSNTLLNMGMYEESIPFLEALIPLYNGNTAQEGDTKAHLAFAYLNTNRVAEAAALVDEAIALIEKNSAHIENTVVWMSHGYIVKSLVESAVGKKPDAEKSAKKALKIAKEGKSPKRVEQAKKVLEYLGKKA